MMGFASLYPSYAAFHRSALERRDRICRRTGAAANWQRRGGQQEIPASARRRRVPERLQVAVIEQMHAEIQEREVMNGAAQVRRRDVLRMVAAEDGDVALLEPRDYRRIKPCRSAAFGAAAQPWPDCQPARPYAGAHEQRVAARYPDARLPFPC